MSSIAQSFAVLEIPWSVLDTKQVDAFCRIEQYLAKSNTNRCIWQHHTREHSDLNHRLIDSIAGLSWRSCMAGGQRCTTVRQGRQVAAAVAADVPRVGRHQCATCEEGRSSVCHRPLPLPVEPPAAGGSVHHDSCQQTHAAGRQVPTSPPLDRG